MCFGWRVLPLLVGFCFRGVPGCAPGGAPTFFVSTKKVGKENDPCCARPSAALRAPCGAQLGRGLRKLAFGSNMRSPCSAQACAPRLAQKGLSPDGRVLCTRGSPIPIPRSGPFCRCRGAQQRAGKGPCMFERSEFARTPPAASTAGCPEAQRRGHRQQGRLSLGYVSLATQRKVTRPPGRDPARHERNNATKKKTSATPWNTP
ncbi:hypothetical protein J2W49_004696 [Hydrogenophaga palleronii]|uniref:Secreted protein n=1 Tax=Hydrogenophaga palleronii TaxID=65655 RepID=A0ABU1WTT6_9BURK|nr:hypothetical protein [Hydrogenophaga palleronii]